jgi:hypothetical protein
MIDDIVDFVDMKRLDYEFKRRKHDKHQIENVSSGLSTSTNRDVDTN